MTPEKQDKNFELIEHWSPESTTARNEAIMKTTYQVNQQNASKSVVIINKCMLLKYLICTYILFRDLVFFSLDFFSGVEGVVFHLPDRKAFLSIRSSTKHLEEKVIMYLV